jgi:predicted AAA+ superfamily ATPase
MNISREVKNKLLKVLKINPVIFVNGPRQAGKSTLVTSLINKDYPADYVSFDKPSQMNLAAREPIAFLQNREHPLIIDEVQRVPEIFRALKVVVDERRLAQADSANGRFLLTGSANIMLFPTLSDALVGRMSVITLYPFAVTEVIGSKGDALERLFAQDFANLQDYSLTLLEVIKLATFPEISGKDHDAHFEWFEGYLDTLLQRDVRMLAELEKIELLPTLLMALAARAGALINDTDIARAVNLNSVTTKNYRIILQMMFLTFELRPWFRNINKRLVKAKKGYLLDTLLLCHLLGTDLEDIRNRKPAQFGHVVENFVASELQKLLTFSSIHATLSHFRTSQGREVDFVLERRDGSIAAIEVKAGENVGANDFKGLEELQQSVQDDFVCGIVLYTGNEVIPYAKNLWAVPFSWLWQ